MQIKPFGNQILVKPTEAKQVLDTGKNVLCEYGTVIAVGDAVEKIKIGDIIGYTTWGINSLDIDGTDGKTTRHYFVPEDPTFLLGVILYDSDK